MLLIVMDTILSETSCFPNFETVKFDVSVKLTLFHIKFFLFTFVVVLCGDATEKMVLVFVSIF